MTRPSGTVGGVVSGVPSVVTVTILLWPERFPAWSFDWTKNVYVVFAFNPGILKGVRELRSSKLRTTNVARNNVH